MTPPPSKLGKITPKEAKKKRPVESAREELRELSRPKTDAPSFDAKKVYGRIALVVGAVVIASLILPGPWPKVAAGVLVVLAVGLGVWLDRWTKKSQKLGELLRQAGETDEGRREALVRLEADFKKGDAQALIARAQLEMQDDPHKALATLESVDLDKQMAPLAAQVRAMRAMLHLQMGDVKEARALTDRLDLDKQQEPKTRVMMAAVASEAWARTGQAAKAKTTLDLFDADSAEVADLRPQLLRARAFACAADSDVKGVQRALKKLADQSPQLLAMFVGQKKVHPLLEKEARQLVQKLGVAPRRMVRARM